MSRDSRLPPVSYMVLIKDVLTRHVISRDVARDLLCDESREVSRDLLCDESRDVSRVMRHVIPNCGGY